MCFLDASKAFDRINHWSLFRKMLNRGIPAIIIRILCYWYRTQKFFVKYGSCTSDPFRVNNGVRQGGILSPHLFAIYVDGLSQQLSTSNAGCQIDNISVNHIFYADDLCLLAPCPSALQQLIDICAKFGIDNDITYNPAKSICMIVKPIRFNLHCPSVSLDNVKLNYVNHVKYLGVILQDTLKDHDDMSRQLRFLYSRCNTLLRKFGKCSYQVLLTLYQSYCAPSYCTFLWCNFNTYMYNKVKVAYNNVFRRIFGYGRRDSASAMFVSNGIDNFDVMYRKNVHRFVERINASNNSIIRTITNNTTVKVGSLWKRWYSCLYSTNHTII